VCGNHIDDDCNGVVDENCPGEAPEFPGQTMYTMTGMMPPGMGQP